MCNLSCTHVVTLCAVNCWDSWILYSTRVSYDQRELLLPIQRAHGWLFSRKAAWDFFVAYMQSFTSRVIKYTINLSMLIHLPRSEWKLLLFLCYRWFELDIQAKRGEFLTHCGDQSEACISSPFTFWRLSFTQSRRSSHEVNPFSDHLYGAKRDSWIINIARRGAKSVKVAGGWNYIRARKQNFAGVIKIDETHAWLTR